MTDGGKIHEVSHLVPLVHTHITKFADHPHKARRYQADETKL
jgi:hypothetical protein